MCIIWIKGENMQINEIEKLVGITKKNVRFYEQQGLLFPSRKNENRYRQYTQDDVKRLLQIKLLRKINVPIEEIRSVLGNEQTLELCLMRHSQNLQDKQSTIERSLMLCKSISDSNKNIEQLSAKDYLDQIEQLELKGVRFMNINKNDKAKKFKGALVAAIVFTVLVLLWSSLSVISIFLEGVVSAPVIILSIIFTIIPIALIAGVWLALIQRYKQLNKGEEDEASKY